jgi:hypothetical protein
VHRAAAEEVEVEMIDALPGFGAVVDHDPIAIAEIQIAGQVADHEPKMGDQLGVGVASVENHLVYNSF